LLFVLSSVAPLGCLNAFFAREVPVTAQNRPLGEDEASRLRAREVEARSADLVLIARRVITAGADAEGGPARGVAVRQGTVMAVGSEAEIQGLITASTQILNLPGATVTAGMVDSHTHVVGAALAEDAVDLSGITDVSKAMERISRHSTWDPTAWIWAWGAPAALLEGGLDRAALDAATRKTPTLVSRADGHAALCNSASLKILGISVKSIDPPGGRVVRDKDGQPTGLLLEAAAEDAFRRMPLPPRGRLKALLMVALSRLAERGLTAVHEMAASPDAVAALMELEFEGRLPVRVALWIDGAHPGWPALRDRGPRSAGGTTKVEVIGVKLFLDGTLGARTAALSMAYSDAPAERPPPRLDVEATRRRLVEASKAGFGVALHCIGDQALETALAALEGAKAAGVRFPLPPRIEHAQIARPDQLARLAALGAVASVQPLHACQDSALAPARLGPDRLPHAYRAASFLKAGIPTLLGSDTPVAPSDPRLAFQVAVFRAAAPTWPACAAPEEALTPRQALAALTEAPGATLDPARHRGRVVPGAPADLVVWDVDPLAQPAAFAQARALATIVQGRVIHRSSAVP